MSAASDERTAQWDVRKDRNNRCLRFAGMVFGIVQYTFVVFVMRFLTGVGLEKSEAKDLLFYSLVLAAVGRIAMSWMSDSWCEGMRKPVLRLNLLGGALTMAVLAFSAFIPFWLVEVGVVAFGFFALTTGVMNQSLGAELAPKGKNGEGAGYATMAVKFGQMFGPPIFGGIVWASQFVLPSGYHFAIGWSLFAALLAIAWVYAGRIVETKSPVKGSGERASATARASRRLKSAA
jgi:sugar phosphate permease